MKKKALLCYLLPLSFGLIYFFFIQNKKTIPEKQAVKVEKLSKQQRITGRFEQEFERTKDPKTGIVPTNQLIKSEAIRQKLLKAKKKNEASARAIDNITWQERGPNNVAGRTRAILIDKRDPSNNTVFAGSISGGLWKTTNFQSTTPIWTPQNEFFGNLAISVIVQDPNNLNTLYFGTGEGYVQVNGDRFGGVRGMGIWKSTNGGNSWSVLANTNAPGYVQDLVIDSQSNIYCASIAGVYRSINGGIDWARVTDVVPLGTDYVGDLEVAADGCIFATYGAWNTVGKILRSFSGAPGTWVDITPAGAFERIEIATAPSDLNRIYAFCEGSGGDDVIAAFKSTNGGNSWSPITVPTICDAGNTSPFTRSQAFYSLIAAVDPSNADILYVGGIDLLRSIDGGVSWTQISSWDRGTCTSIPYVHADHHAIVFETGSNARMIFGTDGGIYHTINGKANLPVFTPKNTGYNVTQFYACAIHPTNENYFLAGAQDNGTQQFTTAGLNNTTEARPGDGAFCHIDQDNPLIQLTAYTRNLYAVSTDGGNTFVNKLFNTTPSIPFINPSDYDNDSNILYAGDVPGKFFRWSDPATAGNNTRSVSIQGMGQITAVYASPNTSNVVYFGDHTGKVLRVSNAHFWNFSAFATTLFTQTNTSVSSITEEEGNANHLLVTYSNYNTPSVWESTNGGSSWTNVEGNLPDMPVRSVLFNPENADQAFIATDLGVWTTDNLNGANTQWMPTNTGLANVRTDMLQYRSSDKLIAAATYGRGLYTTKLNGTSPTTCNAPTNLNVTSLSANSATITWNTAANSTSYRIEYKTLGTNTWQFHSTTAANNTIISGLSSSASYNWRVRNQCAGNTFSDWASNSFTTSSTGSACPDLTITNLQVTAYTSNSINCTFNVNNIGTANANLNGPTTASNDNVSYQVYLSADMILGNADDLPVWIVRPLASIILGVQSGINSTFGYTSSSLNVNPTTHPYLLVKADAGNILGECNESNNVGIALLNNSGGCTAPSTLSLNSFPISNGTYTAQNTINAAGHIFNGGNVTMKAGNSITLNAGFHAHSGATFHAYIAPCSSISTPENTEIAQSRSPSTQQNAQLNLLAPPLQVFPNPFRQATNLRFYLLQDSPIHINIMNSTGQLVTQQKASGNKGWNSTKLAANQLPAGMYYVILQTTKHQLAEKIMILK